MIEFLEMMTEVEKYGAMKPETKGYMTGILKQIHVKKNDYLLLPGSRNDKAYFVTKGLFKCFGYDEEEEYVSWFMAERDIFVLPRSFYNETVSDQGVQALEHSSVYAMYKQNIDYAKDVYPDFLRVANNVTEKYIVQYDTYHRITRIKNSELRYKAFLEAFGHFADRLSNKDIASFLRITQGYVSGIRSKV